MSSCGYGHYSIPFLRQYTIWRPSPPPPLHPYPVVRVLRVTLGVVVLKSTVAFTLCGSFSFRTVRPPHSEHLLLLQLLLLLLVITKSVSCRRGWQRIIHTDSSSDSWTGSQQPVVTVVERKRRRGKITSIRRCRH